MSTVTEIGRKRIRDIRRERIERELRQHQWFAEAPRLVVSGLADLIVVSRELRQLMLQSGLMRKDGEDVHPAVRAFREYKHTELGYIKQLVELHAVQASGPLDLVAAMAEPASDEPADGAEPSKPEEAEGEG
jgi:hypothetical protein